MTKITEKENRILETAISMGGVIRTQQVEDLEIPRIYLKLMVDKGLLVRESKGIYYVPESQADEYLTIQKHSDKIVFSYGTALFLHGLSDRVPLIIDITLPQGYNAGRLKKSHPELKIHYVKQELLRYGVEKVTTPQGSVVIIYNKERCICDIIKDEKKIDKQIFTQAVKDYFKGDYKPRDIIKMAKKIGVEQEVRRYMEVL